MSVMIPGIYRGDMSLLNGLSEGPGKLSDMICDYASGKCHRIVGYELILSHLDVPSQCTQCLRACL